MKTTRISIDDCAAFFLQSSESEREKEKGFLLYTHASPDADTLGSALALKAALENLGKKAFVINPDPVPARLAFLTEGEKIYKIPPKGGVFKVSVDIASTAMLSGMGEEYLKNLVFDLSIDHHEINTVKTKKLLLLPDYPATGEIIAELFKKLGVSYDKKTASLLYAAISSDTGCFRYSSTRPETMVTASELMGTGIDFAKINRRIFEHKTKGQLALEKNAYENLEFFFGGKVAVACLSESVTEQDFVELSDVENVNDIPRQQSGVEVSALIRKNGGEVKVSLRSNDYYDVASLAKEFGGGGHKHAAGCRFYTGLTQAKEEILARLKKDFERD